MQADITTHKKAADKPKNPNVFSCLFFPWRKRRQANLESALVKYSKIDNPNKDSKLKFHKDIEEDPNNHTEKTTDNDQNLQTMTSTDKDPSLQIMRTTYEDLSLQTSKPTKEDPTLQSLNTRSVTDKNTGANEIRCCSLPNLPADHGCLRKDQCKITQENKDEDNLNYKFYDILSLPKLPVVYLSIVIEKVIRDIDAFLFEDIDSSETKKASKAPHTKTQEENDESKEYMSCCVCLPSYVENVHESVEQFNSTQSEYTLEKGVEEKVLNENEEYKDYCAVPVTSDMTIKELQIISSDKNEIDDSSQFSKLPVPQTTLMTSCSRGMLGCPCLFQDVEPARLYKSEKFLQERNFSYYPYNGILNNYVQSVRKNSDIGDFVVDNKQEALSEANSEELITVIDCYDIDDTSSKLFNPEHFYPIPEKVEPVNVWYTGVKLEDCIGNESGADSINTLVISEEVTESGKDKKTIFTRFTNFIENLCAK